MPVVRAGNATPAHTEHQPNPSDWIIRADRVSFWRAHTIMFTVYVLADDCGKLYKGATNNLVRRLTEHQSGRTKTTRHMKNVTVVYTEQYESWSEARSREVYLKSAAGRRFLKKVLKGL